MTDTPHKTLRDEFAMAALTGILASNRAVPSEVYARDAYLMADLMLDYRKNKPRKPAPPSLPEPARLAEGEMP